MSGPREAILSLLDDGRAEEALRKARRVLQAQPDRRGIALLAASAAAALGRPAEIAEEFRRLVTEFPYEASAHAACERLVSAARPAAIAAAERLAESWPEHPVVARLLCEQAIKSGDLAMAQIKGVAGLNGQAVTSSHVTLAHQLLHLGMRHDVLSWVEKVGTRSGAFGDTRAERAFEAFAAQETAISRTSVRLHRVASARAVLFVFSGLKNRPGMPEEALIEALDGLPIHLVFLRDPHLLMYMRGVPDLADGYQATCEAMRELARDLGAAHILLFGVSGGGYAALKYADALDAHSVLCDSALTIMTEDSMRRDGRAGAVADRMLAATPDQLCDMHDVLTERESPISIELLYGEEMELDRAYAERMADIAGVRLRPFPNLSGHPVMIQISNEDARSLLRDFVERSLEGQASPAG